MKPIFALFEKKIYLNFISIAVAIWKKTIVKDT